MLRGEGAVSPPGRAAYVGLFRGVVVLSLVATLLFTPHSDVGARPKCFGRTASIVGTAGRDRIKTTSRADVIVTLGGRDVVEVGRESQRKDRICTGLGRDLVDNGIGKASGGPGDDRIESFSGRILAGSGDDIVTYGGYDGVFGGAGDDFISAYGNASGGSGNDEIRGLNESLSMLDGGPGNDTFAVFRSSPYDYLMDFITYEKAPRPISVNLRTGVIRGWGRDRLLDGDGDRTIIGTRFGDTFRGGDVYGGLSGSGGDDVFRGSAGQDGFTGGSGEDVMTGRSGRDYFVGGPGDDRLRGGPGRDQVSFWKGPVHVDLKRRFARGEGKDVVNGFEDVSGSNWDDRILGTDGPNKLDGSNGSDVIKGRAGNDELQAWWGREERLFGNAGDDQLEGPWKPDAGAETTILYCGAGHDGWRDGRRRDCEYEH